MTTPSSAARVTQPPRFGFSDADLAALPTVYAPGLLAGRRVLVSGAGTGIGKAIAFLFARLGARLAICGRRPEPLEDTADWLRKIGSPEVMTQTMSIRDPEAVSAMMDAVWGRFGGLDMLVNNAGGQFPQAALDYSVKGWNAVIDTNLNGSWYMMQNAARRWVRDDAPGSIVNIVIVIDRGQPGISHSAAARGGVIALSRSLALEWAPHRIRINCVAPGTIESNGFNNYRPENAARFCNSNPMKRNGDVQDIAEAVVYFSASSGKFLTGETLRVDGGGTLWGGAWTNGRPDYFKGED
jgi:NAD(P)-dependent dehydrogenase (short-subunit alcohol dehydrogenase family)